MKKTNELEQLLNKIQYLTNKTLEQIAQDIGYSRPHLTKLKNQKEVEPGNKVIQIIKASYADELKRAADLELSSKLEEQKAKSTATINDKLLTHDVLISRVIYKLAELLSEKTGEPVDVIIRSMYTIDLNAVEPLLK